MSVQSSVKLDDFVRKHGAQDAEYWRAQTLASPLGSFLVKLTTAPDDELIRTANELIELLAQEHQTILRHIFSLYQLAADDKRWMKDHGVPCDLDIDQIRDYVRPRIISVRRNPQGHVDGSISMGAKWDNEHLISFVLKNGRLVRDSP